MPYEIQCQFIRVTFKNNWVLDVTGQEFISNAEFLKNALETEALNFLGKQGYDEFNSEHTTDENGEPIFVVRMKRQIALYKRRI